MKDIKDTKGRIWVRPKLKHDGVDEMDELTLIQVCSSNFRIAIKAHGSNSSLSEGDAEVRQRWAQKIIILNV